MRFGPGRLCHGRPPRALEPVGRLAPLLRTVAWAVLGVGGLLLLLTPLAYAAAGVRLALPVLVAGLTVTAAGALVRLAAPGARLEPLVLPLRTEVGR